MLAIKLRRAGKKHQAAFNVVVDEKRSKLLGQNIEELGWYNPHTKKHGLNADRILYWIKNGAKPTPTAHNLLVGAGIIEGPKLAVHKKKKINEEEAKAAAAAAAAPAADTKKSADSAPEPEAVTPAPVVAETESAAPTEETKKEPEVKQEVKPEPKADAS
ncbi:MAG: 30S ribosomal protein S16 [bacterium]|nr:30S ribosomal protein S16 [bacterium]